MCAGRSSCSTWTPAMPRSYERREEVAHVQDADDVVERAAVDRVARVRRLDHRGQRFLRRQVDRERDHLGPRHHHGRDLLVGEVEDLVEHLLLLLLDLPLLGRAREQHLQLGLGVDLHLAAGRLEPERRAGSTSLERCSTQISGLKTTKKPRTGVETASATPLRVAEGDALRHELADHDVQEGDDQEREHERRSRSPRAGRRPAPAPARRAHRSPGWCAVTPSCIAAMKRGGFATIRSTARALRLPCCASSLDPRAPCRDERVLGRDEVAVQQNQRRDGEEFEEEDHVLAPAGGRLGMTSSSNRIYAAV